ncbi:cupin domain-containing protein [Microbacterium sp.]|uniref:cupin domain-containing protein n=1 Tax=Microbacterium sp. TaxID=51671 RepID=UPI0037355F62
MSVLEPNSAADAAAVALPLEPIPADQVVDGAPEAGFAELADGLGVWEHTPGTSTDVENDEIFVVLSGRATVSFPGSDRAPMVLGPGSVGWLAMGTATVWRVEETLRKVYVSGGA